MGSDLPRLLHPEPSSAPPRRSDCRLPPLSQLNGYSHRPASAPSAPSAPSAASTASTAISTSTVPASSSASSPSSAFVTSAAAPRLPPLTPPPSSAAYSPPAPTWSQSTPWTAINRQRLLSSFGESREDSYQSRLPPPHLIPVQQPVSSQAPAASADCAHSPSEHKNTSGLISASCPKQFHGASISHILSSATPPGPALQTSHNLDTPSRPHTPPPSVPSPPLSTQPNESNSHLPPKYPTPLSPAQTPKAPALPPFHARERSVRFAARSNSADRMPPPISPSRHFPIASEPHAVVTDSYESGSAGDSSTPRHSSTESDDRGSSAPPTQSLVTDYNISLYGIEESRIQVCNRCRLVADAQLEHVGTIATIYKTCNSNGERKDMPALIRDLEQSRHHYESMSESCPECRLPPPQPDRFRLLGEVSPRPNKRKSPSYISSDLEEASFKRRTTPEEITRDTAEAAFSLLVKGRETAGGWTSPQHRARVAPEVEAD